jgi:pimeloyl-ACP methyl ester carboxylesterase
MAYAEWGDLDGRPVVLLHGMPGSRLFCPDADVTAAAGVRLLTIDRPGYGGSDPDPGRTLLGWVDDFIELADQLGLPPCPVIGLSSGGPYALACSVRAPGRVTDVCLIASDAPLVEGTPRWDGLTPAARDLIAAVRRDPAASLEAVRARTAWFADGWSAILPEAGTEPAADDPDGRLRQRPDVFESLTAMFREGARQGSEGFAEDWIAELGPWGFGLGDVRAGVKVWWGDGDRLTDRETTDELVATLPSPVVRIVAGAGHLVAVPHWREILDQLSA